MSIELLREDFLRFSKLHSWYKHIPFEGTDFYVYLKKGQQIRHPIDPQVNDEEGVHWCFTTDPLFVKDNAIVTDKGEIVSTVSSKLAKVRFGPFLRGDAMGCHIIMNDYGEEKFNEWCKNVYNIDILNIISKDIHEMFQKMEYIAEKEQNLYWERLQTSLFCG